MNAEEWRVVADFPDYAVSNLGRVKRIIPDSYGKLTGEPLNPGISSTGYPHVVLRKNGRRHNRSVHRLVCIAFHGNPPTPQHEVAHNDGVRANPIAANLRWATRAENHADKHLHGTASTGDRHFSRTHPNSVPRGERSGQARLNEDFVRSIRSDPRPQRMIAKEYGVTQRAINCVKRGITWGHVQ